MAGAVADGVGSAGLAGLAGAGTPAAGAPPAVAVNLQVEFCQSCTRARGGTRRTHIYAVIQRSVLGNRNNDWLMVGRGVD